MRYSNSYFEDMEDLKLKITILAPFGRLVILPRYTVMCDKHPSSLRQILDKRKFLKFKGLIGRG